MPKMISVSALVALIGAGFVFGPAPAAAQQKRVDDFLLCEQVADPANRMACFELALERLKARKAGEAPPPGMPQDYNRGSAAPGAPATQGYQESRSYRENNTRSPEQLGFYGGKIVARVVRHWENEGGYFGVELDNGQIWLETHNSLNRKQYELPGGNMVVEISRNFIGGYRLKIPGRPGLARVRPSG